MGIAGNAALTSQISRHPHSAVYLETPFQIAQPRYCDGPELYPPFREDEALLVEARA